jgi:2-dehydro-3-deoxyphosphogluconate aldolase / (4S)-4-hydroxy-2-oxoglutarate aldolase
MTRPELPEEITRGKVVAIARRLPPGSLPMLADALLREGIGVLEVTMDATDALMAIESMAGTDLLIGAGTVMSPAMAADAVDAGASFIVAPHTDEATVRWCVERSVPVVPGAMTPSEIMHAWGLGASAVKLFPASVGGPAYLASIRGPIGHVPLIATGGIDAANVSAYLEAGATAVGIGGWLTASLDADTIRARAREVVAAVTAR